MFGLNKKVEEEIVEENQAAAESVADGNNYTGPKDIPTMDGKEPFVGAPDDPRNNVNANPITDAPANAGDASIDSPAVSEEVYDINKAERPKHGLDHLEEEFVECVKEIFGEIDDVERKAKHLLMKLASKM